MKHAIKKQLISSKSISIIATITIFPSINNNNINDNDKDNLKNDLHPCNKYEFSAASLNANNRVFQLNKKWQTFYTPQLTGDVILWAS